MRIRAKGFTLIEIVVVVIVIGILATISFAQYTKAIERTRDEEAKAAIKVIVFAQKNYYMKHGGYYSPSGTASDVNIINTNLNLKLDDTYWGYQVTGNALGVMSIVIWRKQPTIYPRNWSWTSEVGWLPCFGSCP